MSYAEVTDVEARLGRDLDEYESTIVEARLNDVELVIKSRIPDLVQKIDDTKLSVDVVKMVEADAVIRHLRNPEGIVGETDGNYSYQLNWATVKGSLELTTEEWRLLGVRPKFFVISPRLPGCSGNVESLPTTEDYVAVWWDG